MKARSLVFAAALAGALSSSAAAHAFCGFYVAPSDGPLYNDATQVALMRDGTRTVISMSNNYKGPLADFAMVVPVPVVLQKENVKTLPLDTFKHLEALSAPRLVEYWEQDPCYEPPKYEGRTYDNAVPCAAPMESAGAGPKDYGVKVEAKFAVGEYEIVILSAKEADGLERWLGDNKYKIPQGASSALAPYIKEQMKFFVAKVNAAKAQKDAQGVVVLSPLRFNYEETTFRLPVRLGLLNAPAPAAQGNQNAAPKQDLIVYVLADNKRYEVANYPNVFVPTNLDVKDDTRKSFGSFYATLFDAAIAKAGGRAIVTEYAWQASSCDPCPTPPMEDRDVATLGGDVLYGMGTPAPDPDGAPAPGAVPPSPMGGGKGRGMGGMGGYYGGTFRPVVLTRLHTRYDAATLTEDLVFRAADGVVGGREFVVDAKGNLEQGAKSSPGNNNFQARYAIRHPWDGPVLCAKPRRGVWGGPPSGKHGDTSPAPAKGLAAAPRGGAALASYIERGLDDVGEYDKALGLKAPEKPAPKAKPKVIDEPPPPPSKKSCGCSTPGADRDDVATIGAGAFGLALATIGLGRRAIRRRGGGR